MPNIKYTNDNMRYETITLIILFVALPACSGPDQHLQKMAREIYSQKTWEPPLPPKEFKSDGCSCWPDNDWLECCIEHDTIYWLGGTSEERKKADLALQECVSQKDHPIMGRVMYYGVRLGAVPWLPTPFRWGFGWKYPQSGPPGKQY
ncbi:MAG: hypothetical protein KKB30_10700 [Proteobacteria bacterium]|nr:hypothetical protein [Pseudomonadota bacterium]MBU1717180.1 hypothetical protein [Pseudomonadota bacterium]